MPKIKTNLIAQVCQSDQSSQVHYAVTQRTRAGHLQRLTSIRFNLRGNALCLCLKKNVFRKFALANKESEVCHLQVVMGSVIIRGFRFLASVLAILKPLEVIRKPCGNLFLIVAAPA